MKTLQIQRMGMIDNQTFGVWTTPFPDIQLRVFTFFSDAAYEDGILLSTELMREHFRETAGDLCGLMMVIYKTIGRLGPFQDDIGPIFPMECEKTTVQLLTFLFENTYLDLNTCLAQFPDTPTLYFSELIDTAYHYTTYTFLNN